MMSETIGKWNFWIMFIGFNLTFAPQHILGLDGMPRRTYRYADGMGWDVWNLMSTIGAFLIAVSFLIFIWNLISSYRTGKVAGNDPWDARTLEWTTTSPPPVHNFDQIPVVHHQDDFWYRKYGVNEEGRSVKLTPEQAGKPDVVVEEHGIHMPSPSFYPIVSASGVAVLGAGLVFISSGPIGFAVLALGAVVTLWGLVGWAAEPATREAH